MLFRKTGFLLLRPISTERLVEKIKNSTGVRNRQTDKSGGAFPQLATQMSERWVDSAATIGHNLHAKTYCTYQRGRVEFISKVVSEYFE